MLLEDGSPDDDRSRVRFVAALSLALVAVAMVGCGGTEIDEKRTREAILYDVEQKTGVGVEWVRCPSGVAVVPGDEFECRVKARDGRVAIARLEIVNRDADVRIVDLSPAPGQRKKTDDPAGGPYRKAAPVAAA